MNPVQLLRLRPHAAVGNTVSSRRMARLMLTSEEKEKATTKGGEKKLRARSSEGLSVEEDIKDSFWAHYEGQMEKTV